MADVQSYAWTHQLAANVATGETVDVPTPGFDNPDQYDTAKAEVVYDNAVLQPTDFLAAWKDDFSAVTITNGSENKTWEAPNNIYVTVPGILKDPETQLADHETRITALETAVLGTKHPAPEPAKKPAMPVQPVPKPMQPAPRQPVRK